MQDRLDVARRLLRRLLGVVAGDDAEHPGELAERALGDARRRVASHFEGLAHLLGIALEHVGAGARRALGRVAHGAGGLRRVSGRASCRLVTGFGHVFLRLAVLSHWIPSCELRERAILRQVNVAARTAFQNNIVRFGWYDRAARVTKPRIDQTNVAAVGADAGFSLVAMP